MAKASKYTQRKNEAKAKPFVIEFEEQDGRDNIVVPAPDADTLMQAEEAGTTRRFLQIVAGNQYEPLADFISDEELTSEDLMELVRDMTETWGVSSAQVPEGKRR